MRIASLLVALGSAAASHALTIEYALDRNPALLACDRPLYRGQAAEAQACYRNLVAGNPDARIKADAARALGDVRSANTFFQTASKEHEGDPAVLTRWGELFLATHQNDQAIQLFQEALEADAAYAPAKIGLAK